MKTQTKHTPGLIQRQGIDHDPARPWIWTYDDGGRKIAGYVGLTNDCVTRSIAIATGKPYQEVYDGLNESARSEHRGKRKRGISSSRNGVYSRTARRYLESLGWQWMPTMQIGSGCKVHLRADELSSGSLVVCLSRHWTAVVDGIIHDTHDPSRNGSRCVYGYFYAKAEDE